MIKFEAKNILKIKTFCVESEQYGFISLYEKLKHFMKILASDWLSIPSIFSVMPFLGLWSVPFKLLETVCRNGMVFNFEK